MNTIQHPKKRAFLAAYKQLGTIRAACEAAKINRGTYYQWAEHDETFAFAANQAKEEYGDRLEEKLGDIAMDGNVTALIVKLKIAGRYTEKQVVEQRTPTGPPPIRSITAEIPAGVTADGGRGE